MYKKKVIANGNKMIPELRLLPMMVGSIFFTAGLFIMGWTGKASIHWIGFCIGAACVGLGFFAVFQSALAYLVDTYLVMSASTLAANMFKTPPQKVKGGGEENRVQTRCRFCQAVCGRDSGGNSFHSSHLSLT